MPAGVEGSPIGPPRSPRPALRAGRRRPTSSRRERCPSRPSRTPGTGHSAIRHFRRVPLGTSRPQHPRQTPTHVGPPNPLAQTRAWSRPASAPKKAGWTASTGPQGPPEPLNPTTSHPSILRPGDPAPIRQLSPRRLAAPSPAAVAANQPSGRRPIRHAVEPCAVPNWHGRWQRCDCENGEDWGVAKSYYKAAWIGKQPMCAICGGAGDGPRAEHHLTHGVSVWLCGAHRSDEFQRRRAGRDFVASLQAVWRAAGIRSKRHEAALSAHLDRVRRQPQRAQPGSYSWPSLRREAERRFSAGEQPRRVIEDLRRQHSGLPATVPSVRTMRRWFSQARWLAPPVSPPRTGATISAHPPSPMAPRTTRQPQQNPGPLPAGEPERERPRSRAPSRLW